MNPVPNLIYHPPEQKYPVYFYFMDRNVEHDKTGATATGFI